MTPDTQLDASLTHALEAAPPVHVPPDFAARVAASLPAPSTLTRALTPLRCRKPSATHIAAALATAILLLTLCVLAPHTRASLGNLAFDLEMLMLLELTTLTVWLALKRTRH